MFQAKTWGWIADGRYCWRTQQWQPRWRPSLWPATLPLSHPLVKNLADCSFWGLPCKSHSLLLFYCLSSTYLIAQMPGEHAGDVTLAVVWGYTPGEDFSRLPCPFLSLWYSFREFYSKSGWPFRVRRMSVCTGQSWLWISLLATSWLRRVEKLSHSYWPHFTISKMRILRPEWTIT